MKANLLEKDILPTPHEPTKLNEGSVTTTRTLKSFVGLLWIFLKNPTKSPFAL